MIRQTHCSTRLLSLGFILLVALTASMGIRPVEAKAVQAVYPYVECVEPLADGTYRFRLGVLNPGPDPASPNSFILPSGLPNPPSNYVPGIGHFSFLLQAGDLNKTFTWFIGGVPALSFVFQDIVNSATLTCPQGPVGPTGAQGIQGTTGLDGVSGPTGPIGPQGDVAPQGPQGPQGATGATGATGPEGMEGATGITGATGAGGRPGLSGYQKSSVRRAAVRPGRQTTVRVSCPEGKSAISGGWKFTGQVKAPVPVQTGSYPEGGSWTMLFFNPSGRKVPVRLFATCAEVS